MFKLCLVLRLVIVQPVLSGPSLNQTVNGTMVRKNLSLSLEGDKDPT